MKLNFNCVTCNINQTIKVMDLVEIERSRKEEIMRAVLKYLSEVDYNKCNPEVEAGTWDIIVKHIGNNNPYSHLKKYYNNEVSKIIGEIESIVEIANDKFNTILKIVIAGNLIDFATNHKFDTKILKEQILNIEKINLAINDSSALYEALSHAKNIMYLGDNCGEICLDKMFIKYIKDEFPGVKVYYGVRGKYIVNDVTLEDAEMVDMQHVAEVIENGDGSLGTVISKVSNSFREKFYKADVVIAKGQGNYESLSEIDRNNIFHLFMAKCKPVADLLGVRTMSIVCVENKA